MSAPPAAVPSHRIIGMTATKSTVETQQLKYVYMIKEQAGNSEAYQAWFDGATTPSWGRVPRPSARDGAQRPQEPQRGDSAQLPPLPGFEAATSSTHSKVNLASQLRGSKDLAHPMGRCQPRDLLPLPGFVYPKRDAAIGNPPRPPTFQPRPKASVYAQPPKSDYFVNPGMRFYYDELMARQEAIAAAARRAAVVNPRDRTALCELVISPEWTNLEEVARLARSVGVDIAKSLATALRKENYLLALILEHDKETEQLLFHSLSLRAFTPNSQPNV